MALPIQKANPNLLPIYKVGGPSPPLTSMLETSASILEQERFRAPKQETRQETAQRQPTQTLDRSEGRGMKL